MVGLLVFMLLFNAMLVTPAPAPTFKPRLVLWMAIALKKIHGISIIFQFHTSLLDSFCYLYQFKTDDKADDEANNEAVVETFGKA